MNCLITGSSLGIGAKLAVRLASLNYNLFLTYYSNKVLIEKVREEIISKYNVKCYIKKCDLASEDDIKELLQEFKEKLGNLDILVNNAATYNDNLLDNKTKKEFMNVLEVNVVGTFLVTKYALDIMNKDAIIINMASTDGIDTYNVYNLDYAVSKAGIIQMTKSLALILDKKVIAIAPNWVDTESTRSMDKEFLNHELKRINQKELIKVDKVIDVIIDSINNKVLKSGEVIRIYE